MRYEGTFQSDTPSGFGMISYPNGDTYIGEVTSLKKTGKGRMYYKKEQ